MKKKTVLLGLGAGTIILAASAIVKKVLGNKHADDDLNDEEVTKIVDEDSSDNDRGVGSIDDEIPDMKKDAVNDGYKPAKY